MTKNHKIGILILTALATLVLASWHPYKVKFKVEDNYLREPVKLELSYGGNAMEEYILLLRYNRNGDLVRLHYLGIENDVENSERKFLPTTLAGLSDTNNYQVFREVHYEYSMTDKIISLKRFNHEVLSSFETWTYDKNDSLILFVNNAYYPDSVTTDSTRMLYGYTGDTLYKYSVFNGDTNAITRLVVDSLNRIIHRTTTFPYGSWEIQYEEKFVYSEDTKSYEYSKYEIDLYGDDENIELRRSFFIFNENDKLLMKSERFPNQMLSNKIEEYFVYDINGELIQSSKYLYSQDTLDTYLTEFYNEKLDMIKWEATDFYWLDSYSEHFVEEELEYVYDSHGNWTQRYQYREGKKVDSTFRVIEYYD